MTGINADGYYVKRGFSQQVLGCHGMAWVSTAAAAVCVKSGSNRSV
jgi:hypothetical protein